MQIDLQESVLIKGEKERKRQRKRCVYGSYSSTPSSASSFPFYSLSRAARGPISKPLWSSWRRFQHWPLPTGLGIFVEGLWIRRPLQSGWLEWKCSFPRGLTSQTSALGDAQRYPLARRRVMWGQCTAVEVRHGGGVATCCLYMLVSKYTREIGRTYLNIATLFIHETQETVFLSRLPASTRVVGTNGNKTLFSWTWNENIKNPHAHAVSPKGSSLFWGLKNSIKQGGRIATNVATRLWNGIKLVKPKRKSECLT